MKKFDRSRAFEITLPATSANLGPAFDAAALALSLWLKVRATAAREFSVAAAGRDANVCGNPENHLIVNTYQDVLRNEGKKAQSLALQIDNEIPIGKGLGSSAAARLAGIAAAVHFGRLRWDDPRIIAEASVREHHPDNAAACWMGGVAVARMCGDRSAVVASISPKGKWRLLLAVPNEPLATEEARRVLPTSYSRKDAVANVQNSMLLLAGFVQGRVDLLRSALADRFHQPYRSKLCPLLPALQQLTGKYGVVGAVLSGAGPAVLMFIDPTCEMKRARTAVSAYLKRHGLTAELIPAKVVTRGAREAFGGARHG